MGLIKRCKDCGQNGIFLKLYNGRCAACNERWISYNKELDEWRIAIFGTSDGDFDWNVWDLEALKKVTMEITNDNCKTAKKAQEVINKTHDIDAFFSNINIIYKQEAEFEKLYKLYTKFTNMPAQKLTSIVDASTICAFLLKYIEYTLERCESMKTESGKSNRKEKAFYDLLRYAPRFTVEDLHFAQNKLAIKNKLTDEELMQYQTGQKSIAHKASSA